MLIGLQIFSFVKCFSDLLLGFIFPPLVSYFVINGEKFLYVLDISPCRIHG